MGSLLSIIDPGNLEMPQTSNLNAQLCYPNLNHKFCTLTRILSLDYISNLEPQT